MQNIKSERFELRLEPEILGKIDEWRSQQRDLPSRSEAVRKLVSAGLGKPEHMQQFQIARFNVLCAAKAPGTAEMVPEAYAYAWQVGVFPLFNEGARLHLPFADQFDIPRDMVDELTKFFDDRWQEKAVPSFYKLEDYYDVRGGRGFWDRSKLIHTCRYIFLSDSFDDEFWGSLLKGSDHPTEAKSIIRKSARGDGVYLA